MVSMFKHLDFFKVAPSNVTFLLWLTLLFLENKWEREGKKMQHILKTGTNAQRKERLFLKC